MLLVAELSSQAAVTARQAGCSGPERPLASLAGHMPWLGLLQEQPSGLRPPPAPRAPALLLGPLIRSAGLSRPYVNACTSCCVWDFLLQGTLVALIALSGMSLF